MNFLCNELFGLPLPSTPETSLDDWAHKAQLVESRWAWQYDNEIAAEQASWFPSKKRLDALRVRRASHAAKAARCVDQIAPIFPELNPAKLRLEEIKSKELWVNIRCLSLNRAAEALHQGLQLKNLLLEEAHVRG